MFLYIHITRLLFYGLLGGLAWVGDLPWWILGGWLLWDNHIYTMVKVPFTKVKEPKAFNWEDYKGPENHV